jgi:methionyl aminopeptidase
MSRHSVELKTNEQIILMRDAGLATAAALREVRKAIRPGVSTLELDAIAEATIIAKGGHSNFKLQPHHLCFDQR